MEKKKCLIIDEMHPSILPMLSEIGYIGEYRPDIKREEILKIIDQYEGLVIRSKTPIDFELIDKATKLIFIARAGSGVDQIEVEELEKRNIKLLNAPEGNCDALGEHAVGLLLSLLNNIVKSDKEIRQYTWDREGNRGYELGAMTVALIGYGYMAKAFAKRLKAFGCRIIAYDKYLTNYSDGIVEEVSMETIYEQADVLSFHVPLTAETKQMVKINYFESFKKPIWLVNTSRGVVINLKDLVAAIDKKIVRGAALDVLENEKLHKLTDVQKEAFESLIKMPNVVMTPHVAGWSHESYVRINKVLVDKIVNNVV